MISPNALSFIIRTRSTEPMSTPGGVIEVCHFLPNLVGRRREFVGVPLPPRKYAGRRLPSIVQPQPLSRIEPDLRFKARIDQRHNRTDILAAVCCRLDYRWRFELNMKSI